VNKRLVASCVLVAACAAPGRARAPQVEALRIRFEALASIGEFDIKNLNYLKDASFIVLYSHAQAEAAGAFKTDTKVPTSLIDEGMAVEARMQELSEYKFKRDPAIFSSPVRVWDAPRKFFSSREVLIQPSRKFFSSREVLVEASRKFFSSREVLVEASRKFFSPQEGIAVASGEFLPLQDRANSPFAEF
jgi:hypothetical protein